MLILFPTCEHLFVYCLFIYLLFIVIYLDWVGQLQFNMYATLAPTILKNLGEQYN